ncbi:hypothetical protein P9D39_23970, partial [Heyndrickxia oleronia]|uniref:hypothetical protein n=1 Tax=Heyndrickxia oleronia TaxID=38875 RepID=UPI002DBD8CB6
HFNGSVQEKINGLLFYIGGRGRNRSISIDNPRFYSVKVRNLCKKIFDSKYLEQRIIFLRPINNIINFIIQKHSKCMFPPLSLAGGLLKSNINVPAIQVCRVLTVDDIIKK